MKHALKIKGGFILLYFLIAAQLSMAQNDSTKPELSVTIHHFVVNNHFQYLLVETKTKVNNRWQPLKRQVLQLYLDDSRPADLITKVMTDSDGKAKALIPPRLKQLWDASTTHKFIAVTEGTSKEEETTTELEISKAKILIDTSTADSVRTVEVQFMRWENESWQPAKGVEVKIGVERLGGELKIGDEETYTTDSLGSVAAEFKLDSLAGDEKGNLKLMAKVEDDDKYASLSVEKVVPWGIRVVRGTNFGERALWAARGRAPIWLMLMAYSIIVAVWSVIVYLIFRIVRISKLGRSDLLPKKTPMAN
jgi:hypothetical protein